MMPGVGFEEMILLVIVAIIVIGPKDLPLMMRKFGRFTGKMRAMAFEFKQGIDELGRQAELDELRKEVAALKNHTGLNEINEFKRELEQDRVNLEKDVNAAMADPAPVAPVVAGATHPAAPKPLPYAGLSADHPGYDAGEDFRIDGAPPAPAAAEPAAPETPAPETAAAPGTAKVVEADYTDGVHVIPDDEVRPPAPPTIAPAKQDASA